MSETTSALPPAMRAVEVLKRVLHQGKTVLPLPGGGPTLLVPEYTAKHWIKTGAAKAAEPAEPKTPPAGGKKG